MRALEDIVEPHTLPQLVGAGALLTLLPLAGTWVAVGWGDVALVALSAALGVGSAAAVSARRALDRLPLELAPVAARGMVDGRITVRFRACLGRGRSCRPRWTVQWLPSGEAPPRELPVDAVGAHVCGPFVAQVDLPEGEAGAFTVQVAVGDERVERRFEAGDLREGRFCQGIVAGRVLRFDEAWRQVEAREEPPVSG